MTREAILIALLLVEMERTNELLELIASVPAQQPARLRLNLEEVVAGVENFFGRRPIQYR